MHYIHLFDKQTKALPGCRLSLRKALLLLTPVLVCISTAGSAQGLLVSNGSAEQVSSLSSGEQLILTDRSETIQFAGRRINLTGFSGIVGYASEIAYVVTISGSAEAEGTKAERGRMLMIPPFGGDLGVERFDAVRLSDAWDEDTILSAPMVYASLEGLAGAQATGVFLGRLGRTNFNVAASGLASAEIAKRTIVGGEAIKKIRFESDASAGGIEQRIVSDFTSALIRGDVETVAQFIDPLQFGNSDLRGGGDEARIVMAQAMINERNWKTVIGDIKPLRDPNANSLWVVRGPVSRTFITLRRTTDFAFVSNIKTGI